MIDERVIMGPLLGFLSIFAKDPDSFEDNTGCFLFPILQLLLFLLKVVFFIPAAVVGLFYAYIVEKGRLELWIHLILLVLSYAMLLFDTAYAKWPFVIAAVFCVMTIFCRIPDHGQSGFVKALNLIVRWIFRAAAGLLLVDIVKILFS